MIRFIVTKPATVFMFSILIVFMGVSSYLSLPKEAAPEIKQPYVFITTLYPGVAAADVENLVTREIEDELDGLEGLEDVTSLSQQSLSFIFASFSSNVSVETALRRVKERVDIAKGQLPDDVEEPTVQEFSSSSWPIVIVSMSHPDGLHVIDKGAEQLKDELKRIKGVLDVTVAGKLEREVAVEVDPAKLAHYEFSLNDIMFALQAANVAIPGGILRSDAKNYTISVNTEVEKVEEFGDVIVKSGPVKVPLRELAEVRFDFAAPETFSRFNGMPSLTLSITKRTGENIIDIVDQAKRIIERKMSELPPGTEVNYTGDMSRYIRQVVADLENNMATGFILVLAVTVFFLGWVNSLFVSMAIPFSMMLSFFVLESMGITLNMVVLFSLILALGMLVDNGIVIVENIYRHGTMGKSRLQASIDGAAEVAGPIFTSTLTTCLAFFPIVFMPDVMGDFMSYVPKTVIVVLTCSLLVALTINPTFCSKYLKITDANLRRVTEGGGFFGRIQTWYVGRMRWAMDRSLRVLAVCVLIVVAGIVLYARLGKEPVYFPSTDPSDAVVNLELPQGTPLEKTDQLVQAVERMIPGLPASLDNFQATSGRSGSDDLFSGLGEEYHKGHVRLGFKPFQERTVRAKTTVDTLKQRLKDFTGAEIGVEVVEMGPPSGHDVSYEVVGDDYAVLGYLADSITTILAKFPQFRVRDTDYEPARPELAITVDRARAAFHGLSVQEIAGTIRNAINGSVIGAFRLGEDEYDIVLRYGDDYRGSLNDLTGLEVVDKDGIRIAIGDLATVAPAASVGTIKRRNFRRAVGIWADFQDGEQNKRGIRAQIEERVRGLRLPKGYRIEAGEGQEMRQDAMAFLMRAFLIAVFLIVIVLVSQFNSFVQPLIIVASVFLSMGGVFWGYLLSGQEFVIIMSGIGCIALAGVAVNNCIVLVDYTNILLRSGMGYQDAIIEAGRTRLRPVLLTAITTVLGLLPMAFGISMDFHPGSLGIQLGSESSEFWKAFAWAMIYGLSFATVMTLVMVPCMLNVSLGFAARRRVRHPVP